MNNMNYDQDLINELKKTFQEEAKEHLALLNQALLKLERIPPGDDYDNLLQDAFRSAHSLKGAARTVQEELVQSIAHQMEDILKAVRDGQTKLTPDICDVLYDALDGIGLILKQEDFDTTKLMSALHVFSNNNNDNAIPRPDHNIETADNLEAAHTEYKPAHTSDESIRVALSKLDSLMAEVSELMVSQRTNEHHAHLIRSLRKRSENLSRQWQNVRTRMQRLNQKDDSVQTLLTAMMTYHEVIDAMLTDVEELDNVFHRDVLRLNMVTNRIQEDMRRVRMIPFATQSAFLQRIVRDIAREEKKQINLTIQGMDAELDKKVLELLKDPLMHLLRNAVGHGIESPTERV